MGPSLKKVDGAIGVHRSIYTFDNWLDMEKIITFIIGLFIQNLYMTKSAP